MHKNKIYKESPWSRSALLIRILPELLKIKKKYIKIKNIRNLHECLIMFLREFLKRILPLSLAFSSVSSLSVKMFCSFSSSGCPPLSDVTEVSIDTGVSDVTTGNRTTFDYLGCPPLILVLFVSAMGFFSEWT